MSWAWVEEKQKALKSAGIRVIEGPAEPVGVLGDFDITFNNYYWVVKGKVPLKVALALYAEPIGKKDVRVAGHCGCPPPEAPWVDWYTPEGRKIADMKNKAQSEDALKSESQMMREIGEKILREYVFTDEPEKIGEGFVETYHIDSDEGLRFFADTLRAHGVVPKGKP